VTVVSFMRQIFSALDCIHSAGIVHRDLTPSNILVGPNGNVKVCDFGLSASYIKVKPEEGMHSYVVMRWYRAPELLCGASRYGPPIDMWSAGCVLGELLARKPLFAGKTTKDQLKIIVKQLGKPTGAKIREFEKKYEGFNTEGQLDKLPAGTTRDWSEVQAVCGVIC